MLNVFHRDGETIRHFWAWSFSAHQPSPGRIPATSAPSSRSGTYDLTPAGRGTDWDEQLSY
jgi:hypothetical protein